MHFHAVAFPKQQGQCLSSHLEFILHEKNAARAHSTAPARTRAIHVKRGDIFKCMIYG